MKRKKTFIGALIIIALTSFIACSQNEEPSYSCNPKANAWVNGTDFGCGIVWLMDCTGRCAQTL